jgi:putative spermidine/putrescine transport system permease protein
MMSLRTTSSGSRSAGATPRRGWHPHLGPWTGLLFAVPILAAICFFVIYPLVQLLVQASSEGRGFERYIEVFTDSVSLRAVVTTVADSLVVALVTVLIGGLLAWTLHTTTKRWLRVLTWIALLIPFTMGTIVKNYAILLLLVANGPINSVLLGLGVVEEPIRMLYTPFAVVFGISYSLLPYAGLTLYSAFSHVDQNLIASAQVLGATRMRALRTVILPSVRSGLFVSGALIFVLSLGFYVTPVLLGGLQSPFLATVISQQIFTLYDFPGASATAVVVLVIALVALAAAIVFGGRRSVSQVMR